MSLAQQIETTEQRLSELIQEATEAGGFNDEQRTEAAELEAELDRLDKAAAELKATQTRIQDRNKPRSKGRKTAGSIWSGSSAHTPASDNPRSAANIFRDHAPSNGGFESLGDFGAALIHGDSRRLASVSQSYGVPSDGGYLVPPSYAYQMLDAAIESEIVRPRAKIEAMLSAEHIITGWDDYDHSSGEIAGGLAGQWVEEGGTIDIESAKVRRLTLRARKLAMLTKASNELLTDAPRFEMEFADISRRALSWNFDYAFLRGTGAGQPRGVLNDPALITVGAETGQSSATILYQNAVKMRSRLHPRCLPSAVWVCNPTALPELLTMGFSVGAAGGEWVRVLNESSGRYSLLGHDVLFSEHLPTVGTKGDFMLIDFSQYAVGLMPNGMRLDKSMHHAFNTDETTFRLIMRADGQGTWKQPLTPRNGDTLSWCVALEDR